MSADDLFLPDDMELLKSMVRAMAQKTALLEDENAALKARNSDADERIKRLTVLWRDHGWPAGEIATATGTATAIATTAGCLPVTT